jgi:hypothetical protein
MNEEYVRAMVRESIARRLGPAHVPEPDPEQPLTFVRHASHYRYMLPESGGPCLIEPVVRCTHCGFCQSHGY